MVFDQGAPDRIIASMANGALEVRVERFSFFDVGGHTHRFAEHAPHRVTKDYEVCNCTSNVAERPSGKPSHVSQDVVFEGDIGAARAEFRLVRQDVRVEWGPRRPKPVDGEDRARLVTEEEMALPHATFQFGRHSNGVTRYSAEPSVHIGASASGHGPLNYYGTTLFMGPDVDVSHLLHGHSPSQCEDVKKLGKTDLWVHAYVWQDGFLQESIATLTDSKEADAWRGVLTAAAQIRTRMRSHPYQSPEMPIVELWKQAAGDEVLRIDVNYVVPMLADVAQRMPTTQLFQVDTALREEMREIAKRRGFSSETYPL